jgi:pimeloyl-ACP methyl ester carboxylesterase
VTRFPEPQQVALPAADITLSVHQLGSGPAVVFSHGFPELAYSWRHQLPAVADAGFRAIAPDQRGYGGSSKPEPIEAYGIEELTGDLVGLLDALEIEKAVFVGHDWGGLVVWAMPLLHPERTAGIVGLCTPYAPMPPTSAMSALVDGDPERFYVCWFQTPGVAEAYLDARVRLLFERILRGGVPLEQLLPRAFVNGKLDMNPFRRLEELEALSDLVVSPQELDHYISVFERTGFRGGINWYRNIDRNVRNHPEIGTTPLALPCLMLTAEWDAALRPEMAAGMPALCSDLETHMIPKAGHWAQQEYPAEVNARLVDWLRRRFGQGSAAR